jgi:hypothetical protein
MTPEKFIASMDKAIKECEVKKDSPRLAKLKIIRSNLPDYPAMAVLEAEALGMGEKFTTMLQQAFDVKPFMDVCYKKVEVQG